jgi:ligand-binding SRPBCC domain-containing protein
VTRPQSPVQITALGIIALPHTQWQKWLARRDRKGRFPKSRFSALLQRHPLPAARIVHRYTFASETLA